jgi:uncharacterized protein YjdB
MGTKMRKIFAGIITILFMLVISTTSSNAISYTNLELDGNWVSTSVTSKSNPEFYSFTVPSDGTVTLGYQSFASDTFWGLYSYDMTECIFEEEIVGASETSPRTSTATYDLSEGTYCIRVRTYIDTTGGNVRINGSFVSGNTTISEPNDSFLQAVYLDKGVIEKGMITATDDVDFYVIDISTSGQIDIKFTYMINDCNFTLYSSDYQELFRKELMGGNANCPKSYEYLEILDSGRYYIKISPYVSSPFSSYTGGYYISYSNSPVSSITLNKTSLKLTAWKNYQLSATVEPDDAVNKTLEWSSSDDEIATVSKDGLVYAKKCGKAVIYAKSTDGSNESDSCTVYVVPDKVSNVHTKSNKITKTTMGIEWNSSYNADGYRVMLYDKNKKKFVKYRDTSKTSMTIKGLTAETKYRIKVIPYIKDDSKKVFGKESSVYKAYTAPKKLKAPVIKSKKRIAKTSYYSKVKLKWNKVSGATGYYVYTSYNGGKYTKESSLTKTSSVIYVPRGKTVRFKVVAYRTKHNLTTNGKASKTVKYRAK